MYLRWFREFKLQSVTAENVKFCVPLRCHCQYFGVEWPTSKSIDSYGNLIDAVSKT